MCNLFYPDNTLIRHKSICIHAVEMNELKVLIFKKMFIHLVDISVSGGPRFNSSMLFK